MIQEADESASVDEFVRLDFFTEIAKAIASANTLRETMDQVMTHIGRVFAPEHWSLLLRDRRSGDLTFRIVTGSAGDQLLGKRLPRGTGIAGWIAEHAQPVIISDVTRDSRFDPTMDRVADFQTKSIIGVPLMSGNRVFGVIELVNKINGKRFTPLELKILTTIADFAAIAIEKSYYVRAIKKVALLDPLTNLYNRRVFTKHLQRERERVVRHGTRFAVMLIDIDDFKSINDEYGHAVGDEVLTTVAGILRASVRKVDIVSRYAGDEFVIVFPDSGEEAAERAKQRLLDGLAAHNAAATPHISCSIGLYAASEENVDRIFELVDEQMYRDKSRRGDTDRSYGDMVGHLEELIDEEES